jgi:nitrite reductase/ring-hydroxylating ferredoxin subunit
MADFTKVGSVSEFPEASMEVRRVNGEDVCISNVGGKLYAYTNYCPHQGSGLNYGYVDDKEIYCGYHGATFDVETGEAKDGPVVDTLQMYDVRVEGDEVLVSKR